MTTYVANWLEAFALTLAVEIGVAVPALSPTGAHARRRASVVALANLATHPLVWFVFPEVGMSPAPELVTAELFALVVEALTYILIWPTLGRMRAFGTSALANGASLAVGLSLRALGVPI